MDAVAEHLFVFEGDGVVRNFEGIFSEYLDFDKERKKELKSGARKETGKKKEDAVTLVIPPERPQVCVFSH